MMKAINFVMVVMTLTVLTACEKEIVIQDEGILVPKTVEHDSWLPSISVNGTMLHSEAFGHPDSAMLIVLHGGPGGDYRYLLNCKNFANQGYRVIFYDQRGAGLSKRHPKNTYTLQVMFDDLAAVINHYRTSLNQKVFLLGHSWGAMLSTAYVNSYPTKINGLILAEPGGFVWQDVEDYVKRSRDIDFASELTNDLFYHDQFITGKEDQHAILDYKYALLTIADGHKDNPTGNEGRLPLWRAGAVAHRALVEIGDKDKPSWIKNLQEYNTKVLFVYSENNKAYGLHHAQKVSSAYPNVELLKVNGAGHDMFTFETGWSNFFPAALAYLNVLK